MQLAKETGSDPPHNVKCGHGGWGVYWSSQTKPHQSFLRAAALRGKCRRASHVVRAERRPAAPRGSRGVPCGPARGVR